MTSLRRNREAELVLEPRPPDFPGYLCSTLSFSLRNGLDQVHVISPHVVVCKLYVAINRTLLVQHSVFSVSSLEAKSFSKQ